MDYRWIIAGLSLDYHVSDKLQQGNRMIIVMVCQQKFHKGGVVHSKDGLEVQSLIFIYFRNCLLDILKYHTTRDDRETQH